MQNPLFRAAAAAALLLALSACDHFPGNDKEVKYGTLTRNLLLIDEDGRRYGTVELDPVSGGKLMDAQGRVIGTIVTPAVTSTVTTVAPMAPIYPQQ